MPEVKRRNWKKLAAESAARLAEMERLCGAAAQEDLLRGYRQFMQTATTGEFRTRREKLQALIDHPETDEHEREAARAALRRIS